MQIEVFTLRLLEALKLIWKTSSLNVRKPDTVLNGLITY